MSNGEQQSANPQANNGVDQYAFPNPEKVSATEVQHGMTLRDYFAGLAMQALVGKEAEVGALGGALPGVRIATVAYDIANAMVEQRGK
jgi:hypothetical protein